MTAPVNRMRPQLRSGNQAVPPHLPPNKTASAANYAPILRWVAAAIISHAESGPPGSCETQLNEEEERNQPGKCEEEGKLARQTCRNLQGNKGRAAPSARARADRESRVAERQWLLLGYYAANDQDEGKQSAKTRPSAKTFGLGGEKKTRPGQEHR